MTAPVTREELDEPNHDGIDFALEQLCTFLGVDPHMVSWDAATETVDGDVQAVIGNIMRAKYGDDFDPKAGAGVTQSPAPAALPLAVRLRDEDGPPLPQMVAQRRAALAALLRGLAQQPLDQAWDRVNTLGGSQWQDNSYDQGTVDTVAKALEIIEALGGMDPKTRSPVSSTDRGGK
jgi:hypothetical protein